MKGYRFYADLPGTLRQPEDASGRYGDKSLLPLRTTIRQLRDYAALTGTLNCIALALPESDYRCPDYSQEALVSVYGHADSAVACSSVSRDYLHKCRRIPEGLARLLHPRMFLECFGDT